tara:strand:- start:96 stop:317 length:222 start_codon:yes stop_codon:yes gene_type:complete
VTEGLLDASVTPPFLDFLFLELELFDTEEDLRLALACFILLLLSESDRNGGLAACASVPPTVMSESDRSLVDG